MLRLIHNSKITSEFADRISQKSNTDWEFSLNVFLMKFASELTRQMDQTNLSRANLAKLLGTSRPYITQLLKKKHNLRLDTLFKICFTVGLIPEIELRQINIEDFSINAKKTESKIIHNQDKINIKPEIIPDYEKTI